MSKFVNTDTWLTCNMGMKPARMVVTSQGSQTFVDKQGATVEDTKGYNFICTKYLGLIGFLAGILLAALCVLFPAVGFLLLAAVTFIGGLGIAGTIGYLVCCSSYGKPRQWQLQHPTVQIEGKHALVSDSKLLCSTGNGVVTMHESFSGALWTALKSDGLHMLNYSLQFLSGYMVGRGSINLVGAARAGGAAGVGSLFSSGLKNMFSPAGLRGLFAAGNYGKAALQTGMLALGYGSTAYTGYNMYQTATDPQLSLGEKAWELSKESLLQVMFVFGAGNVPARRPAEGGTGTHTEEAPKADDVKPEESKPATSGEAKPAEGGSEQKGGMAETETKPVNVPKKPSYQQGQSDGGPGTWEQRGRYGKPEDIQFQKKVTGAPEGVEYVVKGPNPKGEVKFDGYDPEADALLDAKRYEKWPPLDKEFGKKAILDEAQRQIKAYRNGTPIEWHVASEEKAKMIEEIFDDAGITEIQVIYPPRFLGN
jgi:hypothetical protein